MMYRFNPDNTNARVVGVAYLIGGRCVCLYIPASVGKSHHILRHLLPPLSQVATILRTHALKSYQFSGRFDD